MALPNNRSFDEIVLTGRVADVAATTAGYVVCPVKGNIKRVYSVVEGTTNGEAVISIAINGATALSPPPAIGAPPVPAPGAQPVPAPAGGAVPSAGAVGPPAANF